jgi:chloramphenicol 3-O-phosphotransferase
MTARAHGTLIVLNGTSSSGKTSIAQALQDLLTEPYLQAGIDKFIFMLPSRYLNRPLWKVYRKRTTKCAENSSATL